jgi:hypothetical protein
MFALVQRTLGANDSFFAGSVTDAGGWMLDSSKLLTSLQDASSPVILLGTAFTFLGLLDHLDTQSLRLRLPPGSRALETGGYKGRTRSLPKPELHAFITDRLGITSDSIVCEYGMSELGSQAYDTVAGSTRNAAQQARPFHFPPWARAQIISPETGCEVAEGETGLIRVFDLANVRSVLAVQTEDLGIRRGEGFQLIGRAPRAEARGCSLMMD